MDWNTLSCCVLIKRTYFCSECETDTVPFRMPWLFHRDTPGTITNKKILNSMCLSPSASISGLQLQAKANCYVLQRYPLLLPEHEPTRDCPAGHFMFLHATSMKGISSEINAPCYKNILLHTLLHFFPDRYCPSLHFAWTHNRNVRELRSMQYDQA